MNAREIFRPPRQLSISVHSRIAAQTRTWNERAMNAAANHGLNAARLEHLKSIVEDDIKKDLYFGGTIIVARRGEIGLYEAFGHADSKKTRKVEKDSVFSLFSVSKSFASVLVLRAIE